MKNAFTERCNKAIAELTQMAHETTIPARAAELLNKAAGVKLALSYYEELAAALAGEAQ